MGNYEAPIFNLSSNYRSAIIKNANIQDIISSNDLSILAVCKTWMLQDDPHEWHEWCHIQNSTTWLHHSSCQPSVQAVHGKAIHGGRRVIIYLSQIKRHPCSVNFKSSSFEVLWRYRVWSFHGLMALLMALDQQIIASIMISLLYLTYMPLINSSSILLVRPTVYFIQ